MQYRPKKFLKTFVKAMPRDVRGTLFGFLAFCAIVCVLIPTLSHIIKPPESNRSAESIAPIGLEPYISEASAEIYPSDSDALEPAEPVGEFFGETELSTEILCIFVEEKARDLDYVIRVSYAAVILNRVKSELFGDSITSVIRATGITPSISYDEVTERTRNAVRDALAGADPTLGALYVMRKSDASYESEYSARLTAAYGELVFLR